MLSNANQIGDQNVELRDMSKLKPRPSNPRTHSKKQIRMIANSLEEFGWVNPIIIDAEGTIIAGHGRLEAAKLLGLAQVPVVLVSHMSEAQKRAYVIADNQLAARAGWDEDLLKSEFEFLVDADVDFDLETTGFDTTEIDRLLSFSVNDSEVENTEEVPPPPDEAVTVAGDLWHVGDHRITCGDAQDPAVWKYLLGDDQGAMAFTDPPYNVVINGNVSGLGRARHTEFAMASGEMSEDQFTAFLRKSLTNLADHSVDGAIHFVCMDWRHMSELIKAGEEAYTELKNVCVWAKTNAGMGSFYRSQHEMVFVFKSGAAAHQNNFGLGGSGRHRSNLWTYPGANVFRKGRDEDLAAHPTVKPIELVADAILDCSKPGEIILDAFAGSGATLLAAHHTGRIGAAIEIDPRYVDLTLQRLSELTGEQPKLDDGRSINEVRADRLVAASRFKEARQ